MPPVPALWERHRKEYMELHPCNLNQIHKEYLDNSKEGEFLLCVKTIAKCQYN